MVAVQLIHSHYNAPISIATHFAETFEEIGVNGTATIDNATHSARFQIETVGDPRKTLGPFDPTQPDLNTQLYPVVWMGDSLYRTRIRMRGESGDLDPIDCIALVNNTTTMELGQEAYSTRGGINSSLYRVASPKVAPSEYESYFYGQNATASLTPNANRLRPLLLLFNVRDVGGDGTGADATIVESLEMDRFLGLP